jgi:hypothetical protein
MPSMLSDLKKRLGAAAPPTAHATAARPAPEGAWEDEAPLVADDDQAHAEELAPMEAFEAGVSPQAQGAKGGDGLDYSGRWARPPREEEIAGYLKSLDPSAPAEHDDVEVAEELGFFFAFEGGILVPGACAVVRGWLVDPHDDLVGLYLLLDGEVRAIGRSAHIYRKDVNDYTRAPPGYRAGFTSIVEIDAEHREPQPAKIAALVSRDGEYALMVSSRMIGVSPANHVARVADEVGAQFCRPEEMSRIAHVFMSRIAAAGAQSPWPDRRNEVAGRGEADATLVLVMDRNIDVLVPLLAFLEMRPNHRRLGVVIVFRRPDFVDRGAGAIRAMRSSSQFSFIKLVNPAQPVTFGAAVRRAVELAEGKTLIVASDEVLPPSTPWIEWAMRLADEGEAALLTPRVVNFDGRPDSLRGLAEELPLNHFEFDHSAVADEVDAAIAGRIGDLAAGVIIGPRDALSRAGVFDDCYTQSPFAFADAFLRLRADGADAVKTIPITFTALTLPEHFVPAQSELLFNLYALASTVRRTEPPADTADTAGPPPQALLDEAEALGEAALDPAGAEGHTWLDEQGS